METMSLTWRVPSSCTIYANFGDAGLKYKLIVLVVCTYLFNDCDNIILVKLSSVV